MVRKIDSPWVEDFSDEESDEIQLLNEKIKNHQSTEKQYLREHEKGLDKLGQAIKRQRYMANEIAIEVEVHNEILDDMDQGLTKTDQTILKNARNIQRVLRKSSTSYLWFFMILLAIANILLAIL